MLWIPAVLCSLPWLHTLASGHSHTEILHASTSLGAHAAPQPHPKKALPCALLTPGLRNSNLSRPLYKPRRAKAKLLPLSQQHPNRRSLYLHMPQGALGLARARSLTSGFSSQTLCQAVLPLSLSLALFARLSLSTLQGARNSGPLRGAPGPPGRGLGFIAVIKRGPISAGGP